MKVAVPLLKHSWMFGQEASSHTQHGHGIVEARAIERDLVIAQLLIDNRRAADDADRNGLRG
jgi:hypothetical protein